MRKYSLLFLILITIATTSKQQDTSSQRNFLSPYSIEEMHQFWDKHIEPINQSLFGVVLPVPEISNKFVLLQNQSLAKHGKFFHVSPLPFYDQGSKLVAAAAKIIESEPVVGIFVPSLIDMYNKEIKSSNDPKSEERFQTTVVMYIMHEAQHLVSDDLTKVSYSREETLDNETNAWAETCRYTISGFVSRGYSLSFSEDYYYRGWLDCGKENNECWRSFISGIYKEVPGV